MLGKTRAGWAGGIMTLTKRPLYQCVLGRCHRGQNVEETKMVGQYRANLDANRDSDQAADQAEKLLSKSRAKSTYFLNRKELDKHVTAKKQLTY
jgi:hypothetical protein